MSIDQIISIATPIVAGGLGIISALLVFVKSVRGLKSEVKHQFNDNKELKRELRETRRDINNLTAKINYLVEEKKNDSKEV